MNVTISGRSAQWDLAEISVIAHLAAKSSRAEVPPCVRAGSIVLLPMRTRASGAPFRSYDPSGLGLLATAAIKGRDPLTSSTLRMALAAVQSAEMAGATPRELTDEDVEGVLGTEVKRRKEAARHRVAAIPNRLLPSLEKG